MLLLFITGEPPMNDNPLVKSYTDPKTYVKLPSGGAYYSEKPEMSIDGEVGILPMTAVDEMLFQSPDNLLNGESLFKVLARCVPGIKNTREIPNPDLDAILVGLRIATYGNEMDVDALCPKCEEKNTYNINLPTLLANATELESEYKLELNNDINIKIRPFTVESTISIALYAVELSAMQRQIQMSSNEIDEESAIAAIRTTMEKSSKRLVELISASVLEVTILQPTEEEPDAVIKVTDTAHIKEWVEVLTVGEYKKIRSKVEEVSALGLARTLSASCTSCEHTWDVQIGVDPASFFDMK